MKKLLFKEEYILRREELKKKIIQFFSTETAPKQKKVFLNIPEDAERELKIITATECSVFHKHLFPLYF